MNLLEVNTHIVEARYLNFIAFITILEFMVYSWRKFEVAAPVPRSSPLVAWISGWLQLGTGNEGAGELSI
jgi:hypothetical protein